MPPRSYFNDPRSSDYLAFAKAYFPEKYEDAKFFCEKTGLPFLESADHLASYIGVSASLLRQILHNRTFHYRIFDLTKADGSPRAIATPKTYLKCIQWWICDNILTRQKLEDVTHGFVIGRSYITNAHEHIGCNHLLNMDIKEFFPSISENKIYNEFSKMGYGKEGAVILTNLCSLGGAAPTGAPTSPGIGNLVLCEMDKELIIYAEGKGFKYTRYADDLTFSSAECIDLEVVKDIGEIVRKHGFRVNARKTKFMGRGDRMEVTGIVINDRPNLPREWRNWARGYLYRAYKNPDKYKNKWKQFSGIYGSLKALDPEESSKLTKTAKSVIELLRES